MLSRQNLRCPLYPPSLIHSTNIWGPYYMLGLVPHTGDTIKDTTGLVPDFKESVVWEEQQTLNQKARIGACYWGQVWKPGDKWGMTPLRPVWAPWEMASEWMDKRRYSDRVGTSWVQGTVRDLV